MKKIVERSANIACYSNIVVASFLCASCLVTGMNYNQYYNAATQNDNLSEIIEPDQEEIPSVEIKTSKVTSIVTTKKTNSSVKYVPAKYNEVTGANLVDYAKKFLGLRYVSGGNSLTNGTDCSGFTKLIFNEFGISLSRSVKEQAKQGTYIGKSDLQKGDLVFYGYGDGVIHHVGIYVGNSQVIHESNRRDGVKITSVNMMEYIISRRIITINDNKEVNNPIKESIKEEIYTANLYDKEEKPEINTNESNSNENPINNEKEETTIKSEIKVEENKNDNVYTENTYN